MKKFTESILIDKENPYSEKIRQEIENVDIEIIVENDLLSHDVLNPMEQMNLLFCLEYKLLIEKYSISPFTAVISTHLIEEVATVIENVIIIKKGTIIKNQSCEELLSSGYCISGTASQIDSYLSSYGSSQELIGTDSIGGLKTAYLLGTPDSSAVSGLEVSQMDLQKLFIQLTNS